MWLFHLVVISSQNLTLPQTKKCHFSHARFQTWPLKSIPVFRPGVWEIMSLLLRLERQQKISKKFISSSNITLSLLGIETGNTFMHPVVPSKTIPDSRSKWEKSLPVSRPKGRKSYTLWGCIYLCGWYEGPGRALGYFLGGHVPPGTPNWHPVLKKNSPEIDTPF